MLKRILSISLAFLLIVCALGVLLIGLCDIINGFVRFIDYGFNFMESHINYFHFEHQIEDYYYPDGSSYNTHYYYSSNIVVPSMNLLKNPVLCLLVNAVYNLTETLVKFVFAFALFFFAIYIATYGDGKIVKIARGASGALVVVLLVLFALGNVVMGLVEGCVWIRTMLSTILQFGSGGFYYILKVFGQFITFNILSISNYVIAIVSVVFAAFIASTLLNLIKKKATASDIELDETAISEVEDKEETKAEEVKEEKVEEIKE